MAEATAAFLWWRSSAPGMHPKLWLQIVPGSEGTVTEGLRVVMYKGFPLYTKSG
jgi:hypothetical protein